MSKIEQVQKEMIAAMKAKDTERKETLTLLLSAMKAKAKDKREALSEEEELSLIHISLGLSATLAGVIFGAHSFVQLVLRLPVGMKSEAIGKQKPFVMMGMLFTVVSSMVMWAFPSPAMLLAGNAISGFASTMYVSFTLLYAQYYKKEETGKAMGVLGGVVEVGILAAFVFGGVLYDRAGIRLLFFVSAAVAAVGLAISVFVKEKPAPRQTVSIQTLRSVIRDKRLIVSSVLGLSLIHI